MKFFWIFNCKLKVSFAGVTSYVTCTERIGDI